MLNTNLKKYNSHPTKINNKTFINYVINNKCLNKGSFKLMYDSQTIDEAWSKCVKIITNLASICILKNHLYSVHVTTKINPLAKMNKYVISITCNSIYAEEIVTQITELLNYTNSSGICIFRCSTKQIGNVKQIGNAKQIGNLKKIEIKKK